MLPSTLHSPVLPPSILKARSLCAHTKHRVSCESADRQPLFVSEKETEGSSAGMNSFNKRFLQKLLFELRTVYGLF